MQCGIMKIAVGILRSVEPHLPDCFAVRVANRPYIGFFAKKKIEYVALQFVETCPRNIEEPHFCFD